MPRTDFFHRMPAAALLAAIAFLCLAPLALPTVLAHDQGRLLQVGLLAAVAVFTLLDRTSGMPLPVWLMKGGIALLALAGVSTWGATQPAAAAQEVALLLGLAGLIVQVYRAARSGPVDWAYSGLLAGSCAYFLLTGGIYATLLVEGGPLNARLLHLGFDNPRFFNHCQTLAIPLLIGWSLTAQSRLQRALAAGVASMHFAWLFMDLARASLLGLTGAALWCAWVGAKPFWRRMLGCMLAGAALYAVVFALLPASLGRSWTTHFASPQELTSSHSRDLLLSAAFELARSHPWLGAGPMHFAALVHPKGAHPHNLYLQWAAEFGLPSLLLLLFLLAKPLWRVTALLRRRSSNLPGMAAPLGAALLAALIDAGFSGNFVMPLSQTWIALAYGLLLAALPIDAEQGKTRPTLPMLLPGLLLASQAWLCAQAWQQWQYDPPRISGASPVATADEKPRPRFWQQGWL